MKSTIIISLLVLVGFSAFAAEPDVERFFFTALLSGENGCTAKIEGRVGVKPGSKILGPQVVDAIQATVTLALSDPRVWKCHGEPNVEGISIKRDRSFPS